ncbi:MAG: transglutaminase-like cysteine peptidase [Rickettsiales bacterium]|nr:transglutaminase-like cysteine peptidase [Rickettsiales bacterium]
MADEPFYTIQPYPEGESYQRFAHSNSFLEPPLGLRQMFAAIKDDDTKKAFVSAGLTPPIYNGEPITPAQVRTATRIVAEERPNGKGGTVQPDTEGGFVVKLTRDLWTKMNEVDRRVDEFIVGVKDDENPEQGKRDENWIFYQQRAHVMDEANRQARLLKSNPTGWLMELRDGIPFVPKVKGDCDEYALTKYVMLKEYFRENGLPVSALFLTVVKEQDGAGHVFLTVNTDKGAFVLDNQSDLILPLQELVTDRGKIQAKYTLQSRQSNTSDVSWVKAVLDPKTGGTFRPITAWEKAGTTFIPPNAEHKPNDIITKGVLPDQTKITLDADAEMRPLDASLPKRDDGPKRL